MQTVAVDLILIAGLAVGAWCGVWLNRRFDPAVLGPRGANRAVAWSLRVLVFVAALSIVTVPFDLASRVVDR